MSLQDLDFDRLPVECLSTGGCPYTRWVRIVLDSVFFLYATADDALAGRNPGGTGFVAARGMHPSVRHFAVTNWHVACRDGYSVIRLKKRDGVVDIVELGPHDWTFIPGKYDVA